MKDLLEQWKKYLKEVSMPPPGFLEGSLYKDLLFHGSDYLLKDEEQIDPSLGREYGIYLSTSRKYARRYGKHLYSVFANIKNPIYVEGKYEISPKDLTKEDVEVLKEKGYDSIVVTKNSIDDATEIVVFDSEQLFIVEIVVFESDIHCG